MTVPESNLVAAVERMARALEQLAAAPSVRAVLDEVTRSAMATLRADHGSVSWRDEDGTLRSVVTAELAEDAATAVAARLLSQSMGTAEAPQLYEAHELGSDALLEPEPGLRERLGLGALVASPVYLAESTRVGVLVAWFRQPHASSGDDLLRFGLYARLAGIALAKDRMVEAARRAVTRARDEAEQAEVLRLSRFQAVTEAFSRALTRTQVARVVMDLGLPAVGALSGTVHMVAPDGKDVELTASVGLGAEAEAEFQRMPRDGRTPGHDVARTAAPVWLESPEQMRARYPELAASGDMEAHQSFAFLPLLAEGNVMGVIAFSFGEPRRFSMQEQTSMLGLARQCGLALERALLYEREHVARLRAEAAGQQLRLLADASALLSRSLDWEETVEGVARLAVGTFAEFCIVDALEDGEVRRLAVLHMDPAREELARQLMAIPPEQDSSIIWKVLREGRTFLDPRVIPEVVARRLSDARMQRVVQKLGVHSFIAVPLIARERTLGVLTFVRGETRFPPYSAEDVALAEELARRAALAMDNARLFLGMRAAEEESRQSAARLHLLVRVSQLVAEAGLNLGQVLEVLVHEVAEAIGDGCILQLVSEDGKWLEPAVVHHPEPEARVLLEKAVLSRRMRVGEGLQGAAASTGQTILLAALESATLDGSGPEASLRLYLDHYGAQGVMVVALVAHGRACGSLLVMREARARPYGRDDQLLLESIASRAALAIEDARLYAAALQALRLRDDFLSVAGHELRNPLNALQLQLHVLARKVREDKLSESLAERAERVARTGERLGLLVEDLLDVSRITAGQLRLQRTEVDLSALAHEGVSRMAEELSRAGCEARVEAPAPITGQWDRLRLEQVVMNLLSNAAKYGQGKPVRVRVEAAPGQARLSVQDEGYGIIPEDQERIFQRFQRADATRHIQGLGLGLWICRQIAESHGGTLRVESEPGKGSTFFLELPCTEPGTPSSP